MSCDSNFFVRDGLDIYALKRYIQHRYGDAGLNIINDHYSTIAFMDGEDRRDMSVFLYKSEENDGCPARQIAGKSVMLSLGKWGRSVEILEDIGKNFCGGFLKENDCDDKPWRAVSSTTKDEDSNPIREAICSILDKDNADKDRTFFVDAAIVDFVERHLDEIKKL